MGEEAEPGPPDPPSGSPVWPVAAFFLAFWAVLYAFGALAVLTEDRGASDECSIADTYIVMDEGDLLIGKDSTEWFPVPQAGCTDGERSKYQWSGYHYLGLPVAFLVGLAVAWGVHRRLNPAREIEWEQAWSE